MEQDDECWFTSYYSFGQLAPSRRESSPHTLTEGTRITSGYSKLAVSFISEDVKRLVPTYRLLQSSWCEYDERLVLAAAGTRSGDGVARTTNCCFNSAVSVRLVAGMTNAWCPPAFGVRCGARITSDWCPRSLALVRATSSTAKGEPLLLSPYEQGSKMTTTLWLSVLVWERQ